MNQCDQNNLLHKFHFNFINRNYILTFSKLIVKDKNGILQKKVFFQIENHFTSH